MKTMLLGNTGLLVSALSLGTVELGVPYGLTRQDESSVPDRQQGVELLLEAFEGGVNLLDTAPAYGQAESVVGTALSKWHGTIYVATKVDNNRHLTGSSLKQALRDQLQQSCERIGQRLDLVQIHNATINDITNSPFLDVLREARADGLIGHIGASVYGISNATAAAKAADIEFVQVAFNLLDQQMSPFFQIAHELGTGVLVRSALLKGVLTKRRGLLPQRLAPLGALASAASRWAAVVGTPLDVAAIRFCLASNKWGSVLVGVRNRDELSRALKAVEVSLDTSQVTLAHALANDSELVDPRTWGIS